jgi:hypothetical protein
MGRVFVLAEEWGTKSRIEISLPHPSLSFWQLISSDVLGANSQSLSQLQQQQQQQPTRSPRSLSVSDRAIIACNSPYAINRVKRQLDYK